MGTKANPTVIGAFIVGAVVLIVAAIFVFGGGGLFTETDNYTLYFDSSVNGLNAGAPVKFHGVDIGMVTNVHVLYDPEDISAMVRVTVEVTPDRFHEIPREDTAAPSPAASRETLIEKGLRAQLQMQSFVTGLLFVEFNFLPDTPVTMTGLKSQYPELPTIPTAMEEVIATVQQSMDKLAKLPIEQLLGEMVDILTRIDQILAADEMTAALSHVASILSRVDEGVGTVVTDMPALMEEVKDTVAAATSTLEGASAMLQDVQSLVQHVDGQVEPLAGGTQATLVSAQRALNQARKSISVLEGRASPALGQAEQVLAGVADLTGSNSVVVSDLAGTLEELEGAARSIRILADYLQRNPEALLRGKGRAGGQ